MTGQAFLRLVNEAFSPFLGEMGFSPRAPSISGRFYLARFEGPKHAVSVSFEPGDKALFVMVLAVGGSASDIDDRTKSPRLADLNRRYMGAIGTAERSANEAAFASVVARDEDERALLKSAKELRLVLPRYLANQQE